MGIWLMSSHVFAAPIRLELAPSKQLVVIFSLAHALVLPLVWQAELPVWLASCISGIVLFSAWSTVRRHASQHAQNAVVYLHWHSGETWLIGLANGEVLEAELLRDSYLHPSLLILNFRCLASGRRISSLITRDRLAAECFKRLRVLLRWHFEKMAV